MDMGMAWNKFMSGNLSAMRSTPFGWPIRNCGPAIFSAAHIFFAGNRVEFNVLAVDGFPGEVSTKVVYDDRVTHVSWRNKVNEWQSMESGIKSYSYGVVVSFVSGGVL